MYMYVCVCVCVCVCVFFTIMVYHRILNIVPVHSRTLLSTCVIDIGFSFFFADDLPRKRLPQLYKPPTPEMLAYLDFSVSTTGMLTGVKVE